MTPAPEPCVWSQWTDEHHLVVPRLYEAGVKPLVLHKLTGFSGGTVSALKMGPNTAEEVACATLVLATSRDPADSLTRSLKADADGLAAAGVRSVTGIGDCLAPGLIVDAVYAGHRYAREFGAAQGDGLRYRRERIILGKETAP
jgi:dimethylamine/trimethylamine dehydrogenase